MNLFVRFLDAIGRGYELILHQPFRWLGYVGRYIRRPFLIFDHVLAAGEWSGEQPTRVFYGAMVLAVLFFFTSFLGCVVTVFLATWGWAFLAAGTALVLVIVALMFFDNAARYRRITLRTY